MIVLDIETSGLDFVRNGVWQIAAIDMNTGKEFISEGRLDDEDEIVIIATLAKEEKEPVAGEGAEVVPGAEAAAPGLSVERGKKEEEAPEKK